MEVKVQLHIRRFKPHIASGPYTETFTVHVDDGMSILDALERVRVEQDNTLMYRHSCHHSSCGTCGMIINGQEKLACVTRIGSLTTPSIALQPLSGFSVIGDLAVDMASLFENIGDDWSHLRAAEELGHKMLPEGVARFERFEDCIECGCCVSACPVTSSTKPFMGPAALAALNRELEKPASHRQALLRQAKSSSGAAGCERALACNRVCPTKVYPARQIEQLRRRLRD